MSPEDSIERILFHAQPDEGTFLHMLRPYRGVKQDVLVDVLAALKNAAPFIASAALSRELASALWAISHLGRLWALAPNGMLRANDLITKSDQDRLNEFLETFDHAVMVLLEGGDVDAAFSR